MVGEIETSIYPDTLFADLLVFLRVNGPLVCLWNVVHVTHVDAVFINSRHRPKRVDSALVLLRYKMKVKSGRMRSVPPRLNMRHGPLA